MIEAFASNASSADQANIIEKEYYKDRLLLDGEISDILSNCSDFKANKIFIEAPFLNEIINGDIVSSLLSPHTKELTIKYSKADLSSKRIINLLKSSSKNRKDISLTLQESGFNLFCKNYYREPMCYSRTLYTKRYSSSTQNIQALCTDNI